MPETSTYLHIGQVIRALREESGWKQSELAAKIGVSPEYVSMVETGQPRYTNMKLDTVERFATAFNRPAANLIAMISRQEVAS